MKKTQRKDAFRNIRKRIVSYLSVCLVIMLGLGGVFTTRYMDAGLVKQASDYYDAHRFKVFDLASSYGISEANLEKIRTADKVIDAEGVIQANGSVSFNGNKKNVTIISLTGKVSVPDVAEGKLPEGTDECMIGEDFAEVEGIKVGDRLGISLTGLSSLKDQTKDMDLDIKGADTEANDEEGTKAGENGSGSENASMLLEKEFTVTGLMHHPDFLRRKSDNTVSLPLSAFSTEATEGLYTRAFVITEQPEKTNMFSQEYFDRTEETRVSLEELAEELEEDRTNEVKAQANAYIDEEWAKAEAKLAEAQDEIDAGKADLNAELAAGRKKLNDAQKELDRQVAKYEKLFRNGEKTLAEKEKELKKAKKLLAEKKKELDSARTQIKNGRKELAEKEKELKDGKEKLAQGKETLRMAKEMFGGDEKIDQIYETAKVIRRMIDEIDKLVEEGVAAQKIEAKIKELGTYLLDHKSAIKKIFDFAGDPEVKEILDAIKEHTGKDLARLTKAFDTVNNYGYDRFLEDATLMKESGGVEHYKRMRQPLSTAVDTIIEMIEELRNMEATLKEKENEISEGEAKLADARAELKKYEDELKEGEKTFADYEKKIKNAEKLLNDKKKELRDGKAKFAAERAKNERKIAAGWNEYYAQKARYEEKLEEAIALLGENRELAEEKLAEARAEVDNIDPCDWIVLDRKSNAGYVDIKSNIDAISVMGVLFGILFTIITAIVCFSTLVIIIGEQKTMVGTVKAFGFYKREILSKYLVFGISSAITGIILAVASSMLLSNFVQKKYAQSGMYPIGVAKSIVTPGPTVLFSLIIIAVTIAATVFACGDILRSPASMLMKGAVLRKEKKKKEKTASKGGTLYSRLIVRNMVQDKARVIVTIAIIAFSCMLIGLGISMKYAFDGMMSRQAAEVNRFDIRMDMNADVTDEDEADLVKVLKENGTAFIPATVEQTLYRWNDRLDGVTLICADPENISEFYGVIDHKTGEDVPLPENGILIQKRMHESYAMNVSDTLPVLDSSLNEHDAEISGTFVNYIGRTVVASPQAYRSIFGKESDANSYFVKLNGADLGKVEEELLAVSDNISFVQKDSYKAKYESASKLYNIIVIFTTGIAILISFMILTNLANIYLTRKKTELTIMRVNGFKIKETKGYLSRESVITTAAGLALGVIVGAALTPFAIKFMQQPDLEFVKSFQPVAWAAAVGLEALFSIIINTLVYRKVKDLNLRDIA